MSFVKSLFLAVIAVLLGGSAFVFDASSKAALALDLLQTAATAPSPVAQASFLASAEEELGPGLARAGDWHAGAAEALSGLDFLRAKAESDPQKLNSSAEWAARAVGLAPVQPHAWLRLALLAEENAESPACALEACVARSWETGPMLDERTACARLRLAHRRGLLRADDPRLGLYLAAGVSAEQAAQCLDFLSPDEMFGALMRRAARIAPPATAP